MRRVSEHGVHRAKHSSRRAFTLVELLISVGLIATLLAIALPALGGVVARARETRCLVNIREANSRAIEYSVEHDDLPPHFATNPVQTDSLGVPLVDIPHLRFTLSTNYFSQTWLWLRALRPPSDPVERELTCTGLERFRSNDPDAYAWTSYGLSAALLADPALFTPESMDTFSPEAFRAQSLTSVTTPSLKAMLAEQSVAHFDRELTDTVDLRVPAAPVAYVDGHAAIASFVGVGAIAIPADARSPLPFSHTIRGVRGSDTSR